MDLSHLLGILRRWLWLIGSLVLVTLLVLGWRQLTTPREYESQVTLQLTSPQNEDVELYDRYRAITARDELTVARNNLSEVLRSRETFNRTYAQLGLNPRDDEYELEVRPLRDSDFLYVIVRAKSPELAERIANTHVALGIAYYGEVRAKPASAAKNILGNQLQAAERDLRGAEEALWRFQAENGIVSADSEINLYLRLIENLERERDTRLMTGPRTRNVVAVETLLDDLRLEREKAAAAGESNRVARLDETIRMYQAQWEDLQKTVDPAGNISYLREAREAELKKIMALSPRSSLLTKNVEQARTNYELLLKKHTEAVLKEQTVQSASFIQVIEPAVAPSRAAPDRSRAILLLALIGSLGAGVALAFFLDNMGASRFLGRPTLSGARSARRTEVTETP